MRELDPAVHEGLVVCDGAFRRLKLKNRERVLALWPTLLQPVAPGARDAEGAGGCGNRLKMLQMLLRGGASEFVSYFPQWLPVLRAASATLGALEAALVAAQPQPCGPQPRGTPTGTSSAHRCAQSPQDPRQAPWRRSQRGAARAGPGGPGRAAALALLREEARAAWPHAHGAHDEGGGGAEVRALGMAGAAAHLRRLPWRRVQKLLAARQQLRRLRPRGGGRRALLRASPRPGVGGVSAS